MDPDGRILVNWRFVNVESAGNALISPLIMVQGLIFDILWKRFCGSNKSEISDFMKNGFVDPTNPIFEIF